MSEAINLNMSVSVPDEIYEKFLTELGRDGFVFAKFGEYSLVLSMPDIEPVQTQYDAGMSQDELDKRDAFFKSLNFVKSLKLRDGEYDLSAVDGKHGGTGRRQGSTKEQSKEHAGSNLTHPTLQLQSKDGKILCKCGHWIGIVGMKWQHMDEEHIRTLFDDAYTPHKKQIKYREKCYTCNCSTPTPGAII
jgi:hypothetical protein